MLNQGSSIGHHVNYVCNAIDSFVTCISNYLHVIIFKFQLNLLPKDMLFGSHTGKLMLMCSKISNEKFKFVLVDTIPLARFHKNVSKCQSVLLSILQGKFRVYCNCVCWNWKVLGKWIQSMTCDVMSWYINITEIIEYIEECEQGTPNKKLAVTGNWFYSKFACHVLFSRSLLCNKKSIWH